MKQAEQPGTITALLKTAHDRALGPEQRERAETLLFDRVYRLLLNRARAAMRRERKEHTLTPEGVVSEVYMELFRNAEIGWEDRQHFFSLVSKKIRDVLVAHARRHACQRRGGGQWANTTLTTAAAAVEPDVERGGLTLIVDKVLERMELADPRAAKIGEYIFYGGFTVDEAAELAGVSHSTVERTKKRVKDLIIEECIKEDLQYGKERGRRAAPGA